MRKGGKEGGWRTIGKKEGGKEERDRRKEKEIVRVRKKWERERGRDERRREIKAEKTFLLMCDC